MFRVRLVKRNSAGRESAISESAALTTLDFDNLLSIFICPHRSVGSFFHVTSNRPHDVRRARTFPGCIPVYPHWQTGQAFSSSSAEERLAFSVRFSARFGLGEIPLGGQQKCGSPQLESHDSAASAPVGRTVGGISSSRYWNANMKKMATIDAKIAGISQNFAPPASHPSRVVGSRWT